MDRQRQRRHQARWGDQQSQESSGNLPRPDCPGPLGKYERIRERRSGQWLREGAYGEAGKVPQRSQASGSFQGVYDPPGKPHMLWTQRNNIRDTGKKGKMVTWLPEFQSHLPQVRGMKRRFYQTRGRRHVTWAQMPKARRQQRHNQAALDIYITLSRHSETGGKGAGTSKNWAATHFLACYGWLQNCHGVLGLAAHILKLE